MDVDLGPDGNLDGGEFRLDLMKSVKQILLRFWIGVTRNQLNSRDRSASGGHPTSHVGRYPWIQSAYARCEIFGIETNYELLLCPNQAHHNRDQRKGVEVRAS